MSFSLSTFVVEFDGTPTIAFQAQWQAEADGICRGFLHGDEIAEEQTGGIAIPSVIKVRLASAPEKAAYEAAGDLIEFFGDVKIVKLIGAVGTRIKLATAHRADDGCCQGP